MKENRFKRHLSKLIFATSGAAEIGLLELKRQMELGEKGCAKGFELYFSLTANDMISLISEQINVVRKNDLFNDRCNIAPKQTKLF